MKLNKYPHYHKPVEGLKTVDVYRVLELFEVNDHAIGHAVKKLMCAGKRGGKDFETDIREAVDTLNRRLQMIAEDDSNERRFPTDADGFYAWNGGDNPLKHRCTIVIKCRDGVTAVCMSDEPKWARGDIPASTDVVGWKHA